MWPDFDKLRGRASFFPFFSFDLIWRLCAEEWTNSVNKIKASLPLLVTQTTSHKEFMQYSESHQVKSDASLTALCLSNRYQNCHSLVKLCNSTSIPGYLTIFNLSFSSCRLPWFRGHFGGYIFRKSENRGRTEYSRRTPNSKLGCI